MSHKKKEHPFNVSYCKLFLKGNCTRGEASCWFIHKTFNIQSDKGQDFQTVRGGTIPPDPQMKDLVKFILQKLEALEERTKSL